MPEFDWTDESAYAGLAELDVSALAWEFLRRNPAYRAQWRRPGAAAGFGLAAALDPALDAAAAQPLWAAEAAPATVVRMAPCVAGPATPLRLAPFAVASAVIAGEIHLRLANGLQLLLPAGAAPDQRLAALVVPDKRLALRIVAVQGLRLALAGRSVELGGLSRLRRRRLALALRAHDGRGAGASYRQITAVLLGESFSESIAWRTSSARASAIRLCAAGQRLVRGAYRRLIGGG